MIKQGNIFDIFFLVLFFISSILYTQLIAKGTLKIPSIRKLVPLEAIPEAVGRAVELGRPVHFSAGSQTFLTTSKSAESATGLSVLSRVAKECARLGAELLCTVGTGEALPFYLAVVEDAYRSEGKLENYRPDNIVFVSELQSAFTHAAIGIIARNKVAANILVGGYRAESLALAESGNMVGSIQIAGTNSTSQTPIFVASCDYVLIGEEMMAAGATCSEDISQIGSLFVEDIFKFILVVIALIGSLSVSLGNDWIVRLFKM